MTKAKAAVKKVVSELADMKGEPSVNLYSYVIPISLDEISYKSVSMYLRHVLGSSTDRRMRVTAPDMERRSKYVCTVWSLDHYSNSVPYIFSTHSVSAPISRIWIICAS